MSSPVVVREYAAPPIDRGEILRYMGVRGDAPEVETLLETSLEELTHALSYRICAVELPVIAGNDTVLLGDVSLCSRELCDRLRGCVRAVVFAATVGSAPDRLIARYQRLSPTKALLVQAIGTERVEALCDVFERETRERENKQGHEVRRRYSPGYGDLPLETQRDIFRLLGNTARIGLALGESLLMSPSKSVTAVLGIVETNEKRNGNAE